jgi:hypothetical protein
VAARVVAVRSVNRSHGGGQTGWILRNGSEAGDCGTAFASADGAWRGLGMSRTTRTILLHYRGAAGITALAVLLHWLLDQLLSESQMTKA